MPVTWAPRVSPPVKLARGTGAGGREFPQRGQEPKTTRGRGGWENGKDGENEVQGCYGICTTVDVSPLGNLEFFKLGSAGQ